MKRLSIPLILLCATSFCSAATVPEMAKKQDDHIRATYLRQACEFKYYLTGAAEPELRMKGTFSRLGETRRLDLSVNALDGNTGERSWSETRYLWRDGQMQENVTLNRITTSMSSKEAASRIRSFQLGLPWSMEAVAGGTGMQTLTSILAEPLNTASVIKEADSEVVVDIARGSSRWLTLWMDPKNNYVITRYAWLQGEGVFRERLLTYKNGMLASVQSKQPSLDYIVHLEWKGEPQEKSLTEEAMTSDGDVILRGDVPGEQVVFRNTGGEIKSDGAVLVQAPQMQTFDPTATNDLPAATSPTEPAATTDPTWLYAMGASALCLALLAFVFLFRRKV